MPKRKKALAAAKATAMAAPRGEAPLPASRVPVWAQRDQPWFHACLIVVLTGLVFANSLHNGFHLDDYYRVVDNPGIRQIERPWLHFVDPSTMSTIDRIGGYRPLLPLTLSINYAIAGDSLLGYHLLNLALQMGAAWLVYLLVLRVLTLAPASSLWTPEPRRARFVALAVASLFAIHPVSGIAVNYICARDQLLSQVFWSGSLLLYLRMHPRAFSPGGFGLALLLLTASLMSKGDAVIAPALILCLELTLLGQSLRSWKPWARAALFALPVVGLFAFQSLVLQQSEVGNVVNSRADRWFYALTQARLHAYRYLPQFVWPYPIRQDPAEPLATGVDAEVSMGLLLICGTCAAAWWLRRREPILSFCILAYWITLAPTSSLVPLHHAAVDYRPYPASPYLFLAVSLFVLQQLRAPWRTRLAIGAVAWCAVASVYLNRTWLDDTTLWRHSVAMGGGALAHHNLAMSTSSARERRVLLERALEIAPEYVLAKINLGRTLVTLGEVEDGLRWLKSGVDARPYDGQARYWYGLTLYELRRYPEASRQSERAAELDSRSARAVYQAALALQAVDEHDKALRWLERLQGLKLRPRETDFTLAFSFQRLGRSADAIAAYRRFLQGSPGHVQARFNLGFELMTSKQCALATPEFQRVLALQPTKASAHLHLAACARERGDAADAKRHQDAWEQSQKGKAVSGALAADAKATFARSAE